MRKELSFIVALLLLSVTAMAQTNIHSTNTVAEQILLGNYNPAIYKASSVINHPTSLSSGINNSVSPDSLKSLLLELNKLGNRNTGADTLSSQKGIGSARTWVYNRFQQYSQRNEQRLLASYLQFDAGICNINRHKNTFAVLPGMDTSDKSIIII